MPSTVASVFAEAGLEPAGAVRWHTPVPESAEGVYVVALTDEPRSTTAAVQAAPLDRGVLAHLLAVRPELRLDGGRLGVDELVDRLSGFWLPDEVVLYIGLAGTSVRKRVRQYYNTSVGAKRPHAGGWWLKTLTVLDDLWVHWAAAADSHTSERAMLDGFASGVSPESRLVLHDRERLAPFANLRVGSRRIKRHGITPATGIVVSQRGMDEDAGVPASAGDQTIGRSPPIRKQTIRTAPTVDHAPTQPIAAKDFEAGRIRLPSRSKHLLQSERADVEVQLRGRRLRARWDPHTEPHRRSGVLGFGRGKLAGLVEVEEVLDVTAGDGTGVELT